MKAVEDVEGRSVEVDVEDGGPDTPVENDVDDGGPSIPVEDDVVDSVDKGTALAVPA